MITDAPPPFSFMGKYYNTAVFSIYQMAHEADILIQPNQISLLCFDIRHNKQWETRAFMAHPGWNIITFIGKK